MTHGDLARSNIKYHFRNKERIETWSSITFGKIDHFFLESDQSANTTGKYNTYPVLINHSPVNYQHLLQLHH